MSNEHSDRPQCNNSPESELGTFSDECAKQRAAEYDCSIEYADEHTLQLDIDSDQDFQEFERRFIKLLLSNAVPLQPEYSVRWSRRGNRHVKIHLSAPLPMLERIMLQFFLASDSERELRCYIGMKKGQKEPILFYRPNSIHKIFIRGFHNTI